MSTVAEIESVLPTLTADELRRVEAAVRVQFRQRLQGIVYDDAHGAVTDGDLVAAAEESFLVYDKEEQACGAGQAQ